MRKIRLMPHPHVMEGKAGQKRCLFVERRNIIRMRLWIYAIIKTLRRPESRIAFSLRNGRKAPSPQLFEFFFQKCRLGQFFGNRFDDEWKVFGQSTARSLKREATRRSISSICRQSFECMFHLEFRMFLRTL